MPPESSDEPIQIVRSYEVPTARGPMPQVKFRLNGQWFTVNRPKLSIATQMMRLMENPTDDITVYGVSLVNVLHSFVNYIEFDEGPEPAKVKDDLTGEQVVNEWVDAAGVTHKLVGLRRGRGRIMDRLNDADDALDIMDLYEPFKDSVEVMFSRPTGPSPASSNGLRKQAGRSSSVRTRSTPAKTSGTSRRTSLSPPAKRTPRKATKGA